MGTVELPLMPGGLKCSADPGLQPAADPGLGLGQVVVVPPCSGGRAGSVNARLAGTRACGQASGPPGTPGCRKGQARRGQQAGVQDRAYGWSGAGMQHPHLGTAISSRLCNIRVGACPLR